MPVELTIVESVTELETTVVEVILESASTPGPAGPGVPAGGTLNQVLTKDSGTDYDTSWQDAQGGGGGAPDDADYLVGTAHGDLSAEIVVGTTPGGELGGTWASPTVDATHSGSSHAAVQAAAEATAAAALSSHEGDTTSVHGIADTSVLATDSEVATAVSDHSADTTSVHGIADTSALALTANHPSNATFNDHSARHENGGADEISLAGLDGTPTDLQTHLDDATAAHAGSAISVDSTTLSGTGTTVQASLEELDNLLDDHSARHENGGADEISIAGLDGTSTALQAHLDDAADAHDASAISVLDTGTFYTATDVEGVLAEIAPQLGGGAPAAEDVTVDSTTLSGTGTDAQAVFEELDNLLDDHSARHENGGADEISIAGLDGTSTALQAHLDDAADAHDASAISVADAGGYFTGTDVEAVLQAIGPSAIWQGLVVKASDESVTSSTTVQADNELSFAVVNGEAYEFKALICYDEPNNSGAPDFKWRFAPASGSQIAWRLHVGQSLAFAAQTAAVADSTDVTNGADGNKRMVLVQGTFTAFANTTYELQWAQNTSSVNATRVRAGSYIAWRKIA